MLSFTSFGVRRLKQTKQQQRQQQQLKQLTAGVLKKGQNTQKVKQNAIFSCTPPSGRTTLTSTKLPVCVRIVRRFAEEDSLENVNFVSFNIIK